MLDFKLKTDLIDSSIQEPACQLQQTAKAGTRRNWRDFPLLQNMDAAYVKQSSFDKLTAGWFSWEETAYWARMISPWVSSTSSMRLHQHVWIPTVQECGSSCQLHADKLSIDTNEYETCAINFTLSSESNKLTGNSLNVFVLVNCV